MFGYGTLMKIYENHETLGFRFFERFNDTKMSVLLFCEKLSKQGGEHSC
jgi:hypothetical protein